MPSSRSDPNGPTCKNGRTANYVKKIADLSSPVVKHFVRVENNFLPK